MSVFIFKYCIARTNSVLVHNCMCMWRSVHKPILQYILYISVANRQIYLLPLLIVFFFSCHIYMLKTMQYKNIYTIGCLFSGVSVGVCVRQTWATWLCMSLVSGLQKALSKAAENGKALWILTERLHTTNDKAVVLCQTDLGHFKTPRNLPVCKFVFAVQFLQISVYFVCAAFSNTAMN